MFVNEQWASRGCKLQIYGWFFTVRRYACAVLAMALSPSVRLSVCQNPVFCWKCMRGSRWFWSRRLPSACPTMFGDSVSPKIRVIPSRTLSKTLDLEKFSNGTAAVATVVDLVRPTTVATLSHWASIFVYNTMAVTQRVARVGLRSCGMPKLRSIRVIRLRTLKATFHYAIQVADLVCDLVANLLARGSSLLI